MTTLQDPRMRQDAITDRFVLSNGSTALKPPRDGLERLERVLARPVWTQVDRDRMKRAADGLWEHTAIRYGPCGEDCPRCDIAGRIELAIKEWDGIAKALPFPTPAQVRAAARRKTIEIRAREILDRLKDRHADRSWDIRAGLKYYKTPSVRYRREREAIEKNPAIRRIEKAARRINAIMGWSRGPY